MRPANKPWLGKKQSPEHCAAKAEGMRRNTARRRAAVLHGVTPTTEVVPGLQHQHARTFIQTLLEVRNKWTERQAGVLSGQTLRAKRLHGPKP